MEEFNSHKESDSKEFLEYLSNLDLSNLAADEKNRLQEMIEEKVTKVMHQNELKIAQYELKVAQYELKVARLEMEKARIQLKINRNEMKMKRKEFNLELDLYQLVSLRKRIKRNEKRKVKRSNPKRKSVKNERPINNIMSRSNTKNIGLIKKPANKELMNNDPVNKDPVNKKPTNNHPVNKKHVNMEPVDKEP